MRPCNGAPLPTRLLVLMLIAAGPLGAVGCSDEDKNGNGEGEIDPESSTEIDSTAGETSNETETGTTGDIVDAVDGGGLVELTEVQLDAIVGNECTGLSIEVEKIPAVLQMVVDVSLSMDDPAPGGGGTKWDVTHQALLDAIDLIPGSIAVGLQTYPNLSVALSQPGDPQPNPGCLSESGNVSVAPLDAPGSAQRALLAEKLNNVELLLGTPTHDAYNFGLAALNSYDGPGDRFMLLITDGAPTQLVDCGPAYSDQAVDTAPIVETITGAAAENIRTFVIGSPGSEQGRAGDMREWLSHAALIGGTALPGCSLRGPDFCHFDMSQADNFSLALAEGLGAITQSVSDSCSFEVPDAGIAGETIDKNATSVLVQWGDGRSSLALRDTSGSCEEGWMWNETEIVLCPSTCAAVNADPRATVTVSLECDNAAIDDILR